MTPSRLLAAFLLLFCCARTLLAESAGEITRRHYNALLADLEAYLEANPDAEDADMAYESAIQAAFMSDNTGKVISLLERKYDDLKARDPLPMEEFLQSAMMLAQYAGQNGRRDVTESVYNDLEEVDKDHDDPMLSQAMNMLKSTLNTPQVGDTPEFKGTTLDGRAISLDDYEGKVVLLDFWATWCGPCIAELPNVKEVYDTYKDKGFEIIGISLDRTKDPLVEMIEDKELDWVHLYDQDQEGSLADQFSVTAIPTMYLIGRDGAIAAVNPRGPELEKAVAKLMEGK